MNAKVTPAVHRTVNDLPDEMIQSILAWLPTKDLLMTRSVNVKFKGTSGDLCRRRHVELNWLNFWNYGKKDVYTKSGVADIPWSHLNRGLWKDHAARKSNPMYFTLPENVKFTRTFAETITKFTVYGDNFSLLFRLLQELPHLAYLTMNMQLDGREDLGLELAGYTQTLANSNTWLPSLKHLHVGESNSTSAVEFICIFLHLLKVQLDLISFTIHNLDNGCAKRLTAVLFKVKSIKLTLYSQESMNYLEELALHGVRFRELRILFNEAPPVNAGPLVSFIDSAQFLEKLSISDNVCSGKWKRTLNSVCLPILRHLRELKLDQGYWGTPALAFITPFVTNQFPLCKKVEIGMSPCGNYKLLFATAQLWSVTELTLSGDSLYDPTAQANWTGIFPNLATLTATVNNCSVVKIVSKVTPFDEPYMHFNSEHRGVFYAAAKASFVAKMKNRWSVQTEYSTLTISGRKGFTVGGIFELLNVYSKNTVSDEANLEMQTIEFLCLVCSKEFPNWVEQVQKREAELDAATMINFDSDSDYGLKNVLMKYFV